jgi:hypothetical protein
MSAVEVPAEAIVTFLKSKGFAERDATKVRGNEIVYERAHRADPRYKVLVYTSVRRGATRARPVGKDAIRVCAIFEEGRVLARIARDGAMTRGIWKGSRVHRTGTVEGVFARMLERMRTAYEACSKARPKRDHARCPPPIFIDENSDLARALAPVFDAAQQKHHPGSRPVDVQREFLDGAVSDDEIGDP